MSLRQERHFADTNPPPTTHEGGDSAGPFNICLFNPSFMPAWFWLPVSSSLEADYQQNAFIPNVPRDDVAQSMEAEVQVAEALMRGRKNQYLVACSGGIENMFRYLDPRRGNLAHVLGVMVIGSGGPKGEVYDPVSPINGEQMNNRHTADFNSSLRVENGLEILDPQSADFMLSEIEDPRLREQARSDLVARRKMTDTEMDQKIEIVTNEVVPMQWKIGMYDNAHDLEREIEVARQVFKVVPDFEGFGHLGPLTHPEEITEMILRGAHLANLIQMGAVHRSNLAS